MARSGDWDKAAMAQGDPKPAWPMPGLTPKFSLTSFGGGRPFGCATDKCERWHAGIDLTEAKDGQVVIAPEAGTIVKIDEGWSEGGKAVMLRTDSGLFIVLGGTKLGSGKEFGVKKGDKVKKGQPVGRVLGSYGMIHLETYADPARDDNTPWYVKKPMPADLLNPTWYIQDMVGQPHAHLTAKQKLEALAKLGWYKGSVDAPWGAEADAALKAAQKAYNLDADGVWGEKTEAAIRYALSGGNVPKPAPQPNPAPFPLPLPKPGDQPAPAPKPAGGINWGVVLGAVGAVAVVGTVAVVALSSGKKSRR